MDIILLDYDYYSKYNQKFKPDYLLEPFFHYGLLLKIPKGIKNEMIILPQEHRLNFITSDKFLDSVESFDFISCNKNHKSIYLDDSSFVIENISKILENLYENFPHNFKIVLTIDIPDIETDYLPKICSYFSYPIISGLDQKIYFFKTNDLNSDIDCQTTKILFKQLLKDYHSMTRNDSPVIRCSINVKFTNKAIKTLKLLTSKIFENEKKFTGLEVSDKFLIKEISNDGDRVIVTLDLEDKDEANGGIDSVDVVYSKYTYHTHPKKTYDKFEVTQAWPSWQDFESFLITFKYGITIMHVTATLEGAYITTINPDIIKYIQEWDEEEINHLMMKFYDVPYPSYDIERSKENHLNPKDGQEFCEMINEREIEYKKEIFPPIFKVELIPWEKFTEKNIFNINFISGTNQTCAISDLQYFS
jgi:hypothetical protein